MPSPAPGSSDLPEHRSLVDPSHWLEPDEMSTRRAFLLALAAAGAGFALSGCQATSSSAESLPGPIWPTGSTASGQDVVHDNAPAPASPSRSTGVLARSQWAGGRPVPSLMKPMRPVRYITVHHSAGPVFQASDRAGTISRLESIRRYHRNDRGWGDIGYHFAIDRMGNVWEGRPLRWQGAHVKDHNVGNIGVVVIGNFDQQSATPAQLAGVTRHVQLLMRTYRVPVSRVRTHQEWAPTACPGRSLQRYMSGARSAGKLT